MVWGHEPPAHTVACEEPLGPWDSGFSVLFDDAPTEADLEGFPADERHPSMTLVCLACLIDDHSELGHALDLAREHGVAELDDNGEWVRRRLTGYGEPASGPSYVERSRSSR
jgi:hypothetical protein